MLIQTIHINLPYAFRRRSCYKINVQGMSWSTEICMSMPVCIYAVITVIRVTISCEMNPIDGNIVLTLAIVSGIK